MFYIIIQIWAFGMFCFCLFFYELNRINSRLNISSEGKLKTKAEIEMDELIREYH